MPGMKLATTYYELVPSMSGAQADITRQFTGIGGAASKGFGGSFAKGLKSAVGPAIALLGAASVGSFLKDSIGEAREAQKVGALTNNVIKQTGGIANISAKQVGRLSTAISNKTGMDDEAIQSGANLLLTFKNVRNETGKGADVFNRATVAAADLSAAGFGDLAGTSKQLGKALNDPIKGISALGRAGVTFSEEQKATIKTLVAHNDLLGAQKIILGEVESQVGGAAEASATFGEKASVAFGNFKESIGTALLPTIDELERFLIEKGVPAGEQFAAFFQEKGVPAIKDFAAETAPLAKSILPAIGSALGVTKDALVVAVPLIKQAVDAFNSLPKSVQTAIVLGGASVALGKKTKTSLASAAAGQAATGRGGAGGLAAVAGIAGVSDLLDQTDTVKRYYKDLEGASGNLAKTFDKDGRATKASIAAIKAEFQEGNIGKYADDLHVDLDKLAVSFAENGLQGEYVRSTMEKLQGRYSTLKDVFTDLSPFGTTESDKIKNFNGALQNLGPSYDTAAEKAYNNGNKTKDLTLALLGGKNASGTFAKSLDELGKKDVKPKVGLDTSGVTAGYEYTLRTMSKIGKLSASAKASIHASEVGENALGTNDWRGGPTLIGERGTELVNLPRHSQVIPANQTKRILAASHDAASSQMGPMPVAAPSAAGATFRLVVGQREFALAVQDADRFGGRAS